MACPFTVVVFLPDLKDVGDVRRLAGRTIEIDGAVKLYDGRAEIILNRIGQITGGAAMIPPCPRTTMLKTEATTAPGRLRPTKKPAKTKARPSPPPRTETTWKALTRLSKRWFEPTRTHAPNVKIQPNSSALQG